MTNNLRRIAKENGIEVTPKDTPNTVIDNLRSKQAEGPKFAKEEPIKTNESKVLVPGVISPFC
jgi:hypothetical protein